MLLALAGCPGSDQTVAPSPGGAAKPAFAIDQDFPDPSVLRIGDTYYAYATSSYAVNIQLATSHDLKSWAVSSKDMLPHLPSWAATGKTWAPDVSEVSPEHFVMYYAAADAAAGRQCIGVSTASSPTGPFTPIGNAPLICPQDEGGAIDPTGFVDTDGTPYLVWKNDGNCCGLDTWLYATPLTAERTALAGPSTQLIKQTVPWEGHVIEAPTLIKHAGAYVLFDSANDYSGSKYAIGYATASHILGPYTMGGKPLLSTASTHGAYIGPGGQDVVKVTDGQLYLVFHSWASGLAFRGMNVLPLKLSMSVWLRNTVTA